MNKNTAALLLFLGIFSGCASTDVDDSDPGTIMREAEENISNDRYQMAVDRLRVVKNKFPYSHHAVDAHLRIADVFFLQENFMEAALNYESFKDLHPKHEKVSYAMFRMAKSYEEDAPSNIARDQASAQKSLDAYQEYLNRYPNSPEAGDSKKSVVTLRQKLAAKEMQVADFYIREEFWTSARNRLKKVIHAYADTPSFAEANEKLKKVEPLVPSDAQPYTP